MKREGRRGGIYRSWNLWWFIWRWRKKKMKVESWRGWSDCCCGGDEGGVLVKKRKMKEKDEGKGLYRIWICEGGVKM